jgi:acyl carrier protein
MTTSPALFVSQGSPPPALHANVQNIVATVFDIAPDRVVGDAELVKDLGATSLESFELVMSVEDSFGIDISDGEAAKVVTVGDLERLIQSRQARTASAKGH